MKNVIKCLPLDFWMEFKVLKNWDNFRTVKGKEITPVFNRNGWYYNRLNKSCWFEVNGYAFKTSINDFKFQLDLLNHNYMSDTIYFAYCVLRKENLLSKKQKQELITEEFLRQRRKTNLDMLKFKKSFKIKGIEK